MIWCSARQSKYFQRCNDRNDKDCKDFGNLIVQIKIIVNFERQKVLWTHGQYLNSSYSDHSRTTFTLTTSYFHAHYLETCVMDLLVPTLEKRKKTFLP